ncbi:AraC family transcriptional regulator [Sphingosinicella sp. CPCC 101087]|uniref:helix-turn-helix domain-containing protein n=1 Tax=Sphingosinicella sp. CPCC 101087 TaxID=2497754 RepID=UPI00101CB22C|nr:AraC family transcriptional regulator [Sphingosinicella sp. CPCC 101087]
MSSPAPVQRLPASVRLPWHGHEEGYAAIVLEGCYLEAGDGGRARAEPGRVLVHSPFSGHADWVGPSGAAIVNVPLRPEAALICRSGTTDDPEALAKSLREAPNSAATILAEAVRPQPAVEYDLPDRLAMAIQGDERLSLAEWASEHRVSMRTLSRSFRSCFGLSPAHYRWRARTLAAWRSVMLETQPLASVAAAFGFSDQAHMSRSIRALTGRPPGVWRRSHSQPLSD